MTPRSVTVTVALLGALAALPATADAEELRLAVGGGAGIAVHDPCSYPGSGCSDPRLRSTGASPMVLVGVRGRPRVGRRQIRIGAAASFVLVAPGMERDGSIAAGAVELGVEQGRFAIDGAVGLARVRVTEDGMTGSGLTPSFGAIASARVSPQLAVVGRADLHGMMHGIALAAYAGVGLEWTPRL